MDNEKLYCKLINLYYDAKEKQYTLINNKINNFQMIIIPKNNYKKKIFVQFKIYTNNISSICFKFRKKIKMYSNIHPDGLLVSFDIDFKYLDNKFEIKFIPFKNINESLIKINKILIEEYKPETFTKINWNKIFVINLKRREDRKKKIIEQFEKFNICNYEFIEAIDGLDKNILLKYNNLKKKNITKIITSGHFACLLSHIKSISIAKQRGYPNVMILEDDITLDECFINKLSNIEIPQYDMIYLGGIINKKKVLFNDWVKCHKIMGAYGYILSSNLYDTILDQLNKLTEYVDLFYLKKIQSKYKIILLDDYIKTNLETSDTSNKNNLFVQRLSYI